MLSTFENQSVWLQPHPKLDGLSLIDHLFNRLNGTYPNKWRANFRDDQAIEDWRQAWAEAFDDERLTANDVALGIKSCRRMFDWPPSLTEFLRACRPHLEPVTAFHEAVRGLQLRARGETGEWSHPAIYFAALAMGQHDVMNGSYAALEARWKQALTAQLAKREWPEIPVAAKALTEPRRTTSRNAEARRAMQKLGVLVKQQSPSRDWVKKILDNPQGRSHYAIKTAKEVAAQC